MPAFMAATAAKSLHRFIPCFFWTTALLSVWLCGIYLFTLRPSIGGIDFYFYILNARDLAEANSSAPWARYVYFPGVYRFWEIVFHMSDGTLASLQWVYLGVLLANAGLVAAILATSVTSWPVGLLGAVTYIALAGRLEGFSGCTEPIATIPFLTGLLFWHLLERKGHKTSSLACLSVAFGICLFVKQQAGLLVIGVTALLLCPPALGRESIGRFTETVIVAIGSVATFLIAMWLDGGGYSALEMGLTFATGYKAQGSWLSHLTGLWQVSRTVSTAFLCSAAVCVAFLAFHKKLVGVSSNRLRLLGITTLSTVAGLFQFSRRGYLHYGLLILPCAILSVASAIRLGLDATRSLASQWSMVQRRLVMTLAVIALSCVLVSEIHFTFREATRQLESAMQSQVNSSGQLSSFCSSLKPGSFLFIVPPRHNEIHWACKTKTIGMPLGYGWENLQYSTYLTALNNSQIDQVLVFESAGDRAEEGLWPSVAVTTVINHLLDSGFYPLATYEDKTLYKRPDHSGH
jgi:hypothetical protein